MTNKETRQIIQPWIVAPPQENQNNVVLDEETQKIVQVWATAPRSQEIENNASLSHETRLLVDPYVFIVKKGKICTTKGSVITDYITQSDKVEENEFKAFEKIEKLVDENYSGHILWFSPPAPGKYDCAKVVITTIFKSPDNNKILLNRALRMDVGGKECRDMAGTFGVFLDTEQLRETPILFNSDDYSWLGVLENYVPSQVAQIKSGEDILTKETTYQKMTVIERTVYQASSQGFFLSGYLLAVAQGLIGQHIDSCSSAGGSAFEVFSNSTQSQSQESKILHCTCPICHAEVDAQITNGRIYCPHCGASAPYKC